VRGHLPEDLLVRTKGAPLRICSSQTRCVTRSEPAAVTDPPTDSRRKILQHRLQCLLCTNLEHVRGAPPDTVVLVDDLEALDLDRLSVVCAGHEESVDQFIIYAGYGEVMHRLQVLEMSLWMIQSRGIKSQTRLDQAITKVEKWNATTLGELMRGMRRQGHWPDGMVDKLLKAVDIRTSLTTTCASTSSSPLRRRIASVPLRSWLTCLCGSRS